MRKEAVDVVIIGCGPAGAAAAVQLHRGGINTVVFEREEVGGLLRNANLVENYPGFPGGIRGIELVRLIERQLELVGVAVRFEEVISLEHDGGLFVTETAAGMTKSKYAVVASGTMPKKLEDVEIEEGAKEYLFSEVYPIHDASDKRIVIIGAGDAAFDYALNLSQNNDVLILNRSDRTRCLPLLIERCAGVDSIGYLENHIVRGVAKLVKGGSGLVISAVDNISGKETQFRADLIIAAVGREPNTGFLGSGLLKKIDSLKKDGGLFMIGDVINSSFRQTAISAGDGVRVAMEIYGNINR